MEGDFNLIGVTENTPKSDSPLDLEGDSNPIGANDITPKSVSPLDPFAAMRGLAFLHIEATSDHSSDDDTNVDTEEDEPTFFTGDTLFILEDEDPDTENCKFVLCPMTPYSAETSLNIEDSSQNRNGDLVPNRSLSRRFRCHTSNVDHHYCMRHGSKYCCKAPEPNRDVKETIEKELYDDCLNYLECSDVMTDYANGIWLSALLGNESVFLLETDQDDETKASQNESDVLPSGVTCVNEGSSNTLAMGDLANPCVSHSKAPAVDEKGDLSGDLLKALETEMVITVGHQQNNTSSPQKKEKCKLPRASTAIQDDQAGIEVENSPEEDRSASMKRSNSNPFMELYLVTMTDEPGSDPLIYDCSEEREQGVEKLILEEDVIDKQCPGIHKEEEVHQLSEGEIQDQFTLESTKFYDSGQSQRQEERLMEDDIAVEHVDINSLCTIERAEEDHTKEDDYIKEDDHIKQDDHTKEEDHTKLIQFLKANIQTTEPPSELKVVENPEQEKGDDVQELEGTQIHPVEFEDQDGSHSYEKIGEYRYIQENYGIENEESPVSGLLVSFKNTEINEVIGNESVIVDHGLELINGELYTTDSKPKTLESVSQIVVINSDLQLCTISSDGAIDTKFTENMTDNLEVCIQEYEHEISSIHGNEYSQTMDNCAIKTDDLVGQPPRENADSDNQSMENGALNTDDLADQPPRENSESDNQTMDTCALNPDDLVDQPPRANDESDNMTIKSDDLVGQPPRQNTESDNQTMDNCALKTNDLVGQPPRENAESDNQTMDNCAIKMNNLVDLPSRENAESDNQTMENYAIKMYDLVGQPPRENAESDNQTMYKTMYNCAIKIDDVVGQPPRENDESDNQTMYNCAIKIHDLVSQPPRENSESDNQTMATCALNPDDLVDQPPRANDESVNMTLANCTIKSDDLVGQPPRENTESDNQTMDNCALKTNDLVGQPPRENAESDNQTMDNCAIKINNLVGLPSRENAESENYAIKMYDVVGQPPRENAESDNQTMYNCAIQIDDLVGQPPRENDESDNQTMYNCAIKIHDLVSQPPREHNESDNQTMANCTTKSEDLVGQLPRENAESDNQTMENCAIKTNDLVDLPPRENYESDNQTTENRAIKIDDLVGQPPRENDESDNQTMVNCAIKMYDLADKPPGKNNTMSIPKVSNDTNVCLEPIEGSSSLMVDNSPSTDDNLRTNSVQNVSGKQMKRNASAHQGNGMHSKKKALEKFPLHNFCASISRGHHDITNNVVVENYQGGIAERHLSCFGGNGEMLSLVKTKDGMCSNSTEIEKAHSLHVKDNIPNSQELSQVCRDPDTIRGAELVRAQSIDLDQSGGTSCSLYFIGSPSQCEKGTDSKMVKKKFKSAGKEASKKTENEAKALDVNEGFQPEEEKRLKRQSSIDTAVPKDSKNAPKILHGIQAEMFPDRSGNLKLFCHFGDIHADSTITWTKDSKLLARMHRSPKDDSPVSLAIVQTSKKDQGVYLCTLKNMHGKVTTEFQLTSEVLEQLTRYQDVEGGEEVEFNQLFFREDFITDMYFGGNLHGRIATEDLHFGEGVHRKAFRSTVMCGLLPVFNPGHLCVLKVHNAIAYGTKTNDELVQKNYKLAVQECHVQNTAREYAKIYAAEAEELKEFGTVPEIIPIFLIHRPANNIPYATVEEELIGDFVKYSVKDGKEINFLRRDSEAGQKCCTFQHWVYERTNGNLLVTDMQGVGMKLTDVGIATMSKGYKGFKGNCAVSFIDQFKALHQCNKYCEILSLQPLRPVNPKQKKNAPTKEKVQPIPTTSRKSRNSTKPKNKT